MGTLPSALRSKGLEREGNANYKVATCCMQGWRKDMEDSHVVRLKLPNHPHTALFGVFDGHAGSHAAEFMRKQLWKRLDAIEDLNSPDIDNILIRCVEELDKKFIEVPGNIRNNGCTSCFMIVTEDPEKVKAGAEDAYTIKVASTGDSRAYWGDATKFRCLTDDHKPTRPDERQRILSAGGHVQNDRVDGQLAVSRAIGDWRFKNAPGLAYHQQRVIGTPEIFTTHAAPTKDQWLFICCDGLVEQWSDDQMIGALRKALAEQDDMAHGLTDLLEATLDDGSQDNMSCVLIKLTDGTGYGSATGPRRTFIPGPLFTHRTSKAFVNAYFKFALRYKVEDSPELRIAAYKEDVRHINASLPPEASTEQSNKRIATILQAIRQLERQIKGQKASAKAQASAATQAENAVQPKSPAANLRITVTPPASAEPPNSPEPPLQPEDTAAGVPPAASETLSSTSAPADSSNSQDSKPVVDSEAGSQDTDTNPGPETVTSNQPDSDASPPDHTSTPLNSSEVDQPPPAPDENTPGLQNGGTTTTPLTGTKRSLADADESSPSKRRKLNNGATVS